MRRLLALALALFAFPAGAAQWDASAITSPRTGLVDSPFVNYAGTRIYFAYVPLMFADFIAGTNTYLKGEPLENPHGQRTADLYCIEWNGSAWSAPHNLGDNINTVENEVGPWLSDDELTLIFYRHSDASRRGMISHRASTSAPWGVPTELGGDYGSENQSATVTRADFAVSELTGEIFLWEHRDPAVSSYRGRLGRGTSSGTWTWNAPSYYTGPSTYDLEAVDETQPYISRDGLTLLWNRRVVATGESTLWKATRGSTEADFTEAPISVTAPAVYAWGEISSDQNETGFLAQAVDTTQSAVGYPTLFILFAGTPASSELSGPTLLSTYSAYLGANVRAGGEVNRNTDQNGSTAVHSYFSGSALATP